MALTLKDKVAIVTGASRGIGAGVALELARRGADVMITYTSASSDAAADAIVAQVAALDNDATAAKVRADLLELDAPTTIVAATLAAFPGKGISILVNNAGMPHQVALADISAADAARVWELNVRAPLLLAQAALPHLAGKGRIINIGSLGGRIGFPSSTLYCASKAALEAMTRVWAAELGAQGHTVNVVAPGPVDTEMMRQMPPAVIDAQKAMTPLEHRIGTVDDIAQVVAWLAEEGSRWVTGQVIAAAGGQQMY